MILGFLIGIMFVVFIILAYAAGYVTAAQKIQKLNEEQDLDER